MTNFHKIFSATTLALTLISLLSTINLNFNLALAIPDDDIEYLVPGETIHDVLSKYSLPKGLVPDAVKSFSWSGDGNFEVELERSCYVQLEELLYYEKKITGHFYYGSVSKVTGIRAKFFFDWVPVTGIDVDRMLGRVEFFFGFLSTEFLDGQFNSIPICLSRPNELESSFSEVPTLVNGVPMLLTE